MGSQKRLQTANTPACSPRSALQEMLAEAIMRGEAADVYVSANVTWMWRLQRARMVRHSATGPHLRVFRLCLITRSDLSISRFEDWRLFGSALLPDKHRPTLVDAT